MSAPSRTYGGLSGEDRRLERRERWMAAGVELFGTVGVRATSLRALSRESGVAERYFAENFADVEDLFVAVHDRLHEELTAAVLLALQEAGPSVLERARVGVGALVDGFVADPRSARIKLVENAVAGPEAQAARLAGQREVAAFLVWADGPPRRTGGIVPEVIGLALAAGIFDLITAWHAGRLELDRDELVEHCAVLCAAVHHGLSAR